MIDIDELKVAKISNVRVLNDKIIVNFTDNKFKRISISRILELEKATQEQLSRFSFTPYTLRWDEFNIDLSNKHLYYYAYYLKYKNKKQK